MRPKDLGGRIPVRGRTERIYVDTPVVGINSGDETKQGDLQVEDPLEQNR